MQGELWLKEFCIDDFRDVQQERVQRIEKYIFKSLPDSNSYEENYKEKRLSSQANWRGRERNQGRGQGYNSNIQCYKCQKYGHYANNCNSNRCYNCGRMGHDARDCRAKGKVEETINLGLDDATN